MIALSISLSGANYIIQQARKLRLASHPSLSRCPWWGQHLSPPQRPSRQLGAARGSERRGHHVMTPLPQFVIQSGIKRGVAVLPAVATGYVKSVKTLPKNKGHDCGNVGWSTLQMVVSVIQSEHPPRESLWASVQKRPVERRQSRLNLRLVISSMRS